MHVFIDTNILLNFFHFTKEELDALNDVFASHELGSATVHLTQQVRDEFTRNREGKIHDALKRFKEEKFSAQLPSFMKAYDEFEEIRKLCSSLQKKTASILEKARVDIVAKDLIADRLIREIFEKAELIETTRKLFDEASMRSALGNPPGKKNAIGDALNWTILLQAVPESENIHVISEDGDFFSTLDEESAHPFLEEEWHLKKKSSFKAYRTLSKFMKEHFDGVAFSFNTKKDELIDGLKFTVSFASTHSLIRELEAYPYYSLKEVVRILDAVRENSQVRLIVDDYDILDFLNRVAVPRLGELENETHKTIVLKVIEDQRLRAERGF